jgi:peptide/nickel transport system substrate-binding protein
MQSIFKLGKSGYPDSFDPATTNSRQAMTIPYVTYQRLFNSAYLDKGRAKIVGDLAKEWEINSESKSIDVYLKHNRFFSDGTPINSNSVVFSIERAKLLNLSAGADLECIELVEAVTPFHVRIKVSTTIDHALAVLSGIGSSIVNPRVLDFEASNDLGALYLCRHTMGSGPYEVSSVSEDSIILTTNSFFEGVNYFKKVLIRVIPNSLERIKLLNKGELDVIEDLSFDDIELLESYDSIRTICEFSDLYTGVFINSSKPYFNKKMTRYLRSLIDKEKIVQYVFKGSAKVVDNHHLIGVTDLNTNIQSLDVEELDEVCNLPAKSLVFLSDYPGEESFWNRIGETIADNFEKKGIFLNIEKNSWNGMKIKINNGDYDLSIGDWVPRYRYFGALIRNMFDSRKHGLKGNQSFYKNTLVKELFKKADCCSNEEESFLYYKSIIEQINEDSPYLLLLKRKYMCALLKNIKGYTFDPFNWQLWDFHKMYRD